VPTHCALEPAELVELAGFRGRLDEIGLPSLLCILETERRTGMLVLTLEPGRGRAQLHLSEGRIFRAHLEGREEPRNAELVYGLIAGMHGTFDFRPSGAVLGDDIQSSTTRLLIEGARRMSEASPDPSDEPAPLEAHPAPCRGCRDEAAPVEREKRGATPDPARRGISAKGAVAALGVAAFVTVVLMALFCSGQAPDSLRGSRTAHPGRVSFPPQ
jgi:hypothetical protein